MHIRVSTVNLKDGTEEDSRVVDFGKKSTQQWLNSHMFWCFNNKRGVQIVNYEDRELEDRLYVEG